MVIQGQRGDLGRLLAEAQAQADAGAPTFLMVNFDGATVSCRPVLPSAQAVADVLNRLQRHGLAANAVLFVGTDADKAAYPDYFEAVLPKLARRGLIAADNTLWSGRVLDPSDTTEDTVALRRFNDALVTDPRGVVVQTTVRDGVTLIRRAD